MISSSFGHCFRHVRIHKSIDCGMAFRLRCGKFVRENLSASHDESWSFLFEETSDFLELAGQKHQDVVQADQANYLPLVVHHGQSTKPATAHDRQGRLDGSLFHDRLNVGGHDVADRRIHRIAACGENTLNQIAIGHQTNGLAIGVHDDQCAYGAPSIRSAAL